MTFSCHHSAGATAGMQARSDPGQLHVAEAAADILRKTGMFMLTDRGEMAVEGKGVMHTYFVDGLAKTAEKMALTRALTRISTASSIGAALSLRNLATTGACDESPAKKSPWVRAMDKVKAVNTIKNLGRGVIGIKHFTDVESPPPPPRVCVSIRSEVKSVSHAPK